jgi:hypothetical protein
MSESTYPLLEVLDHRGRPVYVVIWHLRSIGETEQNGQVVTLLEYANGDTLDLDLSENPTRIIDRFYETVEGEAALKEYDPVVSKAEPTEQENFIELMRKLVRVPKKEVVAAQKKAKSKREPKLPTAAKR